MRRWRDDPLVAADQRALVCDPIGALAARPDSAIGGPSDGWDVALESFIDGCRGYDEALARFPLERARWEAYWNDSLNEGVNLAPAPWMREVANSQARLAALYGQWRDLTVAPEQDRARGCAALGAAGLAPEVLARAC
jgi:hypothetical protein